MNRWRTLLITITAVAGLGLRAGPAAAQTAAGMSGVGLGYSPALPDLECAAGAGIGLPTGPLSSSLFMPDGDGVVRIRRVGGPVTLDGMSDEPAWQSVPALPATVHSPNFGAEPSERTEFRIAYDDEYLYASGRLYDSDADEIRATSLKRDDNGFSNDWFGVTLDTYNDEETTLSFGTTPAGIRTDFVTRQDAQRIPRLAYDTFWDVAVERTEEGWFAEIRIPLSSLRFQRRDGRVIMGVTVWRRIARRNEMITYPAISPEWGVWSPYKASQAQDMAFEGVRPRKPVRITPYLLGGVGRTQAAAVDGTGFETREHDVRELGGALKYGVTDNLVLDLTYNTDFAQVESENQEVNLTRFDISLPEKRPFFLERRSSFGFETGDDGQLFYSRRIGIEDGRKVPILAGGRLAGRAGGWDIGLLDMQTESLDGIASENFGVLRLRRRVLNEQSYVGAIGTSRVGDDRTRLAFGADALLRLFGQDFLALTGAATADDAATGDVPVDDRALLRARWERRGLDRLGYAFELSKVGGEFDPPVGFVRRRGHIRAHGGAAYGWRMPDVSRVLRHTASFHGTGYRRDADGEWGSAGMAAAWNVELKSGRIFEVEGVTLREDLTSAFVLSDDVDVPTGEYTFHDLRLGYAAPPGSLVRANIHASAGSFYDGWKASVEVAPTWNASRHLELGGLLRTSRIGFPDRDQDWTAHLARLRARLMLDHRLALTSFVQYNSAAGDAVVNLRLRYNAGEGHDLYLVYDEGLNADRDGLSPRPPLSDRRTLMVKYSRTFTLELAQ